ncbi:terminase small subunit family protein [Striga asiatica]|uniref:Terminase small subunit family protein n=1 Tax=Striga asiatica TaxID=4170 RepID=A0A5A7PUQ9_STRAF|nr:terminase small subunit family protein [Striga asiatica]
MGSRISRFSWIIATWSTILVLTNDGWLAIDIRSVNVTHFETFSLKVSLVVLCDWGHKRNPASNSQTITLEPNPIPVHQFRTLLSQPANRAPHLPQQYHAHRPADCKPEAYGPAQFPCPRGHGDRPKHPYQQLLSAASQVPAGSRSRIWLTQICLQSDTLSFPILEIVLACPTENSARKPTDPKVQAIDIIFKFSCCTNCVSFGSRAIDPSSSTISHKTPAGSNPASTARSTAASVCPALLRTPPSRYFNGNMCPGRLKSSGFESFDARAFIVIALSRAETPVLVPCFASYIKYLCKASENFLNILLNQKPCKCNP